MKRIFRISVFVLALVFLAIPSFAMNNVPEQFSISPEFKHNFKSTIKGTDLKVSSSRYGLTGSYSYYTLSYDYTDYSWDGIRGTKPWTGLHRLSLDARRTFLLNPQWLLVAGGAVNSSFEKQVSDSFGARADLSFVRLFNNGWSAGVGAAAFYHPARSMVLPALSLAYDSPGDHGLSFRLAFPESTISYQVNQKLGFTTYAGMTARIYRLKNSSPVQEKGYFRDQAIRMGLDMEYSPANNAVLSLGPYYLTQREWKLYNKRGSRLDREKLRSSPGVRASFTWRF